MIRTLHAAELTDRGLVREANEDSCHQQVLSRSDTPPCALLIIADGMGGHMAGEVASRLTVETVAQKLSPLFALPSDSKKTRRLYETAATRILTETDLEHQLKQAIQEANRVIINHARQRQAIAGDMGTTITAAVIRGEDAVVANVGDSRAYLLHNGVFQQITRDHSLVASLVAAGQLDAEDIYTHPMRSQIYRSLGTQSQVEIDTYSLTLQPDDLLLLCSDGLWEMVRDSAMAEVLANSRSPEHACRRLVEIANQNGGADNISIVIAQAA